MADELQAIGDRHVALAHHEAALGDFSASVGELSNTRYRLESSWSHAETGWLEHEFHDERAALADFARGWSCFAPLRPPTRETQLARSKSESWK